MTANPPDYTYPVEDYMGEAKIVKRTGGIMQVDMFGTITPIRVPKDWGHDIAAGAQVEVFYDQKNKYTYYRRKTQ